MIILGVLITFFLYGFCTFLAYTLVLLLFDLISLFVFIDVYVFVCNFGIFSCKPSALSSDYDDNDTRMS